MTAPNLNYAWAEAILSELRLGGVEHAVVCPGSRSSPLAVTCAQTEGLQAWSVIDERSAGFFALGLAQATEKPVVLVATSGSAGAHFLPALIEAAHSHVPLVVLTADRPWELQGFGAPQTIAQQELFGRFVRRFDELALPEPTDAAFAHLRAVVARAVGEARRAPRGAVHLNVPFREPLAPVSGPVPTLSAKASARSFASSKAPAPEALAAASRLVDGVERGVIVCGPRRLQPGLHHAVRALSDALGWPVLAEAASNLRFGPAEQVVAHYDTILQHEPTARALRPEAVLKLGGGITSKRLQAWLDACGAKTILCSDEGAIVDPLHVGSLLLEGDALAVVAALATSRNSHQASLPPASHAYRDAFVAADRRVRAVFERELTGRDILSEPAVARDVAALLPEDANLFVSSSMPIRELDAYAAPERPALRVFANRGANGIDGIVSSALGVAASARRPTVLLTGDLAFLHDLGGLLTAKRHGIPLTVVVVNNDGGGIFSFLPIASATPHFEEFFGTPHGLELSHAAHLYGATYAAPTTRSELRRALAAGLEGGLHVVEVRVRREDNPRVHRELAEAARAALDDGGVA